MRSLPIRWRSTAPDGTPYEWTRKPENEKAVEIAWGDDAGKWQVHHGDCLDVMRSMPAASVDCCVTSPPYWGLRDYGTASWEGGDAACDHIDPAGPVNAPSASSTLTTNGGRGPLPGDKYQADRKAQFRRECGKCCATRVDEQLGLEPTPAEYVARMVEVFREVRRVLKDDGTLWLNLGDSYAAGGNGTSPRYVEMRGEKTAAAQALPRKVAPDGLKPKDLVGIPWRVAFALQQPYYTGRIKDERDRIWLAAMIDAEGCLFIHRRKAGASNGQGYVRQNDSFGPGLEVANTCRAIVERCQRITGLGSICEQTPKQNDRRKQTIYRWNLRTIECRDVVREVYPHFVAKRRQARILCACPSSGPEAAAAHAGLIALHRGTPTDVDAKAPASMFEPGWYLRSDIIWSKANPMPESVTDRPTKAHEYLFLLSKSERYHYDDGAIREANSTQGQSECAVNWRDRPHNGEWPSGTGGRMGSVSNGRNKRTVWTIPTEPFPGAHFAVMPTALVKPCVLAGCRPGGTVLDPFTGSGTVGYVALENGCGFVGVELNPDYVEIAKARIAAAANAPLFDFGPTT